MNIREIFFLDIFNYFLFTREKSFLLRESFKINKVEHFNDLENFNSNSK